MELMNIGFAFLTAMLLCLSVSPLIIRFATATSLFDLPDTALPNLDFSGSRRVHRKPIPRLGGIAIFVSFLIAYFLWSSDGRYRAIIACSALVFGIGLIDDIFQLPAKSRLIMQTLCTSAAVLIAESQIEVLRIVPGWEVTLPYSIGFALSCFIVVGAVNSINMVDGLDGLAGGIVLIGIVLLSLVHVLNTGDLEILASYSVPLIGALMGFLRYNTHPARLFMGDCGSNWLGFMTGMLMLMVLTGAHVADATPSMWSFGGMGYSAFPSQAIPLLTGILCLALPITDTAFVMARRLRESKSPFRPDQGHFHHTLLRYGLSHGQCVTAIYFFSLLIGILGVLPVIFPREVVWGSAYSVGILLAAVVPLSSYSDGHFIQRIINSRLAISRNSVLGPQLRRFLRLWERGNRYLMYAALLITPIFAGVVPREIGLIAGVTAGLIALTLLSSRRNTDVIDSLILSAGAGVIFIANNQNHMLVSIEDRVFNLQDWYNYSFFLLAASSLLYAIVTVRKRYFLITPSDFLLVTLPLIFLLVPNPYQSQYRLSVIALRCMVFFIAVRITVRNRAQTIYRLRLISVLGLLYVFATSVVGMRILYHSGG